MKRAIFVLLLVLLSTSAFAIATGWKSHYQPPSRKFIISVTGAQGAAVLSPGCDPPGYDGTAFYGPAGRYISGDTCLRSGGNPDEGTCVCVKGPAPQPVQVTPPPTGCQFYDGILFYGQEGRAISGDTCDRSSKQKGANCLCTGRRNQATCVCEENCACQPTAPPVTPPAPQPTPPAPTPTGCRFYDGTAFYGSAGAQITKDTCDRTPNAVRDEANCRCLPRRAAPAVTRPAQPTPAAPQSIRPFTPQIAPGPADCSRCLPPGVRDCTDACRNIPMPRKMRNAITIGTLIPVGTCAFPGSTNPGRCCQCSFRQAAAPVASQVPASTPASCAGECLSRADCSNGFKFFTNGLPFLMDPRRGRIISPCQPDFGRFVPPCTRPGIGLSQCSQAAGTCVCP